MTVLIQKQHKALLNRHITTLQNSFAIICFYFYLLSFYLILLSVLSY